MKALKYLILLIFFIVFVFFYCNKPKLSLPDLNSSLNNKLKDFNRTCITPVLNTKIIKGFNLIYCSTFQISWNKLCDEIVKNPIIIDADKDVLDSLNNYSTIDVQLENSSYVAKAGFVRDNIINKINDELNSKFSFIETFDNDLSPDDIISYSYLRKNLMFKYEFEKKDNFEFTSSNGAKSNIKAFGINDYDPIDSKFELLGSQLETLYFKDNSYIVKIFTQSEDDIIVVSTFPPKDTLIDSYNDVAVYIKNELYGIFKNDTLLIPKISLNISHNFNAIENKNIKNKQFEGYFVKKAIQKINFEISEKGAKIESQALLELPKSEDIPRKMLFNKPFLLFIKKIKAKLPYFMIYVDNDEVLKKN